MPVDLKAFSKTTGLSSSAICTQFDVTIVGLRGKTACYLAADG